jgi:hypothetical protein
MAQLGPFLKKLATDPQELKDYRKDPKGTMTKAGLSPAEEAAMESKDPAKIKAALGGGAQPADLGIIIIIL